MSAWSWVAAVYGAGTVARCAAYGWRWWRDLESLTDYAIVAMVWPVTAMCWSIYVLQERARRRAVPKEPRS